MILFNGSILEVTCSDCGYMLKFYPHPDNNHMIKVEPCDHCTMIAIQNMEQEV